MDMFKTVGRIASLALLAVFVVGVGFFSRAVKFASDDSRAMGKGATRILLSTFRAGVAQADVTQGTGGGGESGGAGADSGAGSGDAGSSDTGGNDC
jgi:hypothetical protein